jgi:hypothetical protein
MILEVNGKKLHWNFSWYTIYSGACIFAFQLIITSADTTFKLQLGGLVGGVAASWLVGPAWKYESTSSDGRRIFADRAPIFSLIKKKRETKRFYWMSFVSRWSFHWVLRMRKTQQCAKLLYSERMHCWMLILYLQWDCFNLFPPSWIYIYIKHTCFCVCLAI